MSDQADFSKYSVLYLEDEPLIALDTVDLLDELGFGDVKPTYRLKSANQAVEEQTFDVAILDINVDEDQTSLALGEHLQAQGTPVVFASGNGHQASELRGSGFVFIDKPFSKDALAGAVVHALEL
ncbi:MAG: response regulator [Pseudomonadota bacterium]